LARKRSKPNSKPADPFLPLISSPTGELRLESVLKQGRLEGHAWRYTIVLPLLSEKGDAVFTIHGHLADLTVLLNRRFGGSTLLTPAPQPPITGAWESTPGKTERDQNTSVMVYSRPVESADQFFGFLKSILKQVGVQQEILIEKSIVWLVPALSLA
jgi:hypothetical protein